MRTTLCTVARVPTVVQIGGLGRVQPGIELRRHDNGPLLAQRFDQLDGAFASNCKRQNGMGKQNGIANGQNGDLRGVPRSVSAGFVRRQNGRLI